jgi:hypothetical protein
VNKRAITWLLTALLAISASAAVPVVRARTANARSAIVWVEQDRAEQRVLVQPRHIAPNVRPTVPLNYEPPAEVRHFAAALYQRPPPFLR